MAETKKFRNKWRLTKHIAAKQTTCADIHTNAIACEPTQYMPMVQN